MTLVDRIAANDDRGMNVEDLVEMLGQLPPDANVTVAVAPGRRVPIRGTRITMERDAGELCQPAEVTLLTADAPIGGGLGA
jgi:hypothetical protein